VFIFLPHLDTVSDSCSLGFTDRREFFRSSRKTPQAEIVDRVDDELERSEGQLFAKDSGNHRRGQAYSLAVGVVTLCSRVALVVTT
jgi:hypothetical protein